MSPAPAPARARRAAPARRVVAPTPVSRPPADRRHLRVVDEARVSASRRRRRARGWLALVGTVGVLALFALAGFHAMLASGQAHLDQLEAQVNDARARYESLRLDVAELEAPNRIVLEAQTRLGMVPPAGVTYLQPSEAVTGEVGRAASAPSPSGAESDRAAWASMKPYLSGRP